MAGTFSFSKQPHYAHMKPADVHIWEKFIDQKPGFFDSCDYDVLVGEGNVYGDVENDPYARGFQQLTQKKIDAVCYKGEQAWIIEIKPRAASSALGQVRAYAKLFREKYPEVTDIVMAVITDQPQSDFTSIYADEGITLLETGFCEACYK